MPEQRLDRAMALKSIHEEMAFERIHVHCSRLS
jgi:hypothetical protein